MNRILLKTIIYRILTIAFDTIIFLIFKMPFEIALSVAFLIEVVEHSLIYFIFENLWEKYIKGRQK